MNFLDLGWQELLLILIVVLIVFGPGRVAEIGKTLGRAVRAFRKVTSDITAQMASEMEEEKSSGQGEKKKDRTDEPAKS